MLQFAPSTYYDNKSRPPSRRSVSDAELKKEIMRIWEENFAVYGAEKIWWQLHREGIACGRDRVARLMRQLGILGVTRQKTKRTTVAKKNQALPEDLVRRNFTAEGPKFRRALLSRMRPDRQERVLFVWEQAIRQTGGYFYSRLLLAFIILAERPLLLQIVGGVVIVIGVRLAARG